MKFSVRIDAGETDSVIRAITDDDSYSKQEFKVCSSLERDRLLLLNIFLISFSIYSQIGMVKQQEDVEIIHHLYIIPNFIFK